MNTLTENIIRQAVTVLQSGGVIAYPTEAVYGMGCDPLQDNSIRKVLQIKQRPADKGLILIASNITQLMAYIDLDKLPDERWQEIQASWPGPFTWLIPARQSVSDLIRGQHSSIAVRVSAHPVVRELCDAFGGAIISTSANLSGEEPTRTVEQTRAQLAELVDYIVDGKVGDSSKPSEIRDALTGALVRAGS